MNGLKIKRIIVTISIYLDNLNIENQEVDAIILDSGAALVAKGDSYSFLSREHFQIIRESELLIKEGVSLVELIGARPRTINIDFGG